MQKINVVWFRRDLRISDNTALMLASESNLPILPIFIFDPTILEQLPDRHDRRVDYIHQALVQLCQSFLEYNIKFQSFYGKPIDVFNDIAEKYIIENIFCNSDYEPAALERDHNIKEWCSTKNSSFISTKDQVIFEKNEIVKNDGSPYTVYTPYAKKWRSCLTDNQLAEKKPIFKDSHSIENIEIQLPTLQQIGFAKTDLGYSKPILNKEQISSYHLNRDFPNIDQTSKIGIALRFGTISIRECVQFALLHNDTWLSELIWREFFMQILFHFPKVQTHCFKAKYEPIKWINSTADFEKWCKGETGYPIVDAGMRQLNETGFMHNRVRMIVASFLCKHLLIDWRWGEAYFAQKLNDYDLAANNGNWQWAAGTGCDAAPYFRIFNPTAQTLKFDKDLKYIRKWNPDYEMVTPIIAHDIARKRCLEVYKDGLNENNL